MSEPPQGNPSSPYPHDPGRPSEPYGASGSPASQGYPGGQPQPGYPQWGAAPQGQQEGQPPYQPHDPYAYGPSAPGGPYGSPAPAPTGPQGLRLDFGGRLQRRPEPRFGVSLAAAGIGIAIVGVLIWSFGYLVQGVHFDERGGGLQGDSRRFLGFGLSLLLVLAGYGLTLLRRHGPLASAGAVAGALGVPIALTFLTLDLTGGSGGFPVNTDLVYLLSVLVWLASYLFVPGMRGRAFLLAAAALTFAGYLEFKTVSDSVGRAAASVFGPAGLDDVGDVSTAGGTAVGLIFGLGYYALAFLLDRKGMHGASVALVVAGAYTTVSGIALGVATFKQIGTGVVLIVLGAVLSWYGASSGRRFTTWFWMIAFVAGFGLIVQKALPDSPAGSGITLILIGLAVVAVSQLVGAVLREPLEFADGTSGPAAVAGRHR